MTSIVTKKMLYITVLTCFILAAFASAKTINSAEWFDTFDEDDLDSIVEENRGRLSTY